MAQDLQKATIKSVIPDEPAFEVIFNPNQYQIVKNNTFSEEKVAGRSSPHVEWSSGSARTFTTTLFFDTYDPQRTSRAPIKDSDVRTYIQQITKLQEISQGLHAPPICQFSWGNFVFIGYLEKATVAYTLFLSSGVPVRATVHVAFKEYILSEAERRKLQSANYAKHYVVRPGDTLTSLAAREYEDPTNWRPIARENNIDDPLSIRAGQTLILPAIE